jgi:RHS repeat-associated protein
MNTNGNRFKKISYKYDLVSGKVNRVNYQQGWSDQGFHRYNYDAENRLTMVESSFDDKYWEKESQYEYYKHGPLARMVISQQAVQGIDYAYTLHGWLKGVNSINADPESDIGNDASEFFSTNTYVGRDILGFGLYYYSPDNTYFSSDYKTISGDVPFSDPDRGLGSFNRPLYNGNISSFGISNRLLTIPGTVGKTALLYAYKYDQLNRLTAMDAYNPRSVSSWISLTPLESYRERVTYDGNGNIMTYVRNGHKGHSGMDSLTYHYNNSSNQLNYIQDAIPDDRYGLGVGDISDIDNQASNNFKYDPIGNLVKDNQEGISNIKWSVYGKILEIQKTTSSSNSIKRIKYAYDVQGNRISKIVENNNGVKNYTWYVRDAQGNVLSIYESMGGSSNLSTLPLVLSEQHLYGSSRLGIYSKRINVDNGPRDMSDSNMIKYWRGFRRYEFVNHLGNVLATFTDRKNGIDTDNNGFINYFEPDVLSVHEYYPFGMLMAGRNAYKSENGWVAGQNSGSVTNTALPPDIEFDEAREEFVPTEYVASSSIEFKNGFSSVVGDEYFAYITSDDGEGSNGEENSFLNGTYRYGFNGKENDNEVKETGNQQDYGMRIYDPRLGRFLSVDPLTKSFSMLTPYQFASNRPIEGIDLDGEEFLSFHKSMYRMEYNQTTNETTLGNGTKVISTNSNTIVKTVYANIPTAIQDPVSRSFKYVGGGPVTDMGRDYTPDELSNILMTGGKYFATGPKFYGAAEGGKSTGGIQGLKGNATQQTLPLAQGINSVGGVLGPNGVGGMILNQVNQSEWNALGEEYGLRKGFYNATSLVDYQIENNLIGNKDLASGTGRAALINFISDGYLSTDGGTEFALQVAYEGLQSINNANVAIRDKTKKSVQELLGKYKNEGGDNRYDKINTFLNQPSK